MEWDRNGMGMMFGGGSQCWGGEGVSLPTSAAFPCCGCREEFHAVLTLWDSGNGRIWSLFCPWLSARTPEVTVAGPAGPSTG